MCYDNSNKVLLRIERDNKTFTSVVEPDGYLTVYFIHNHNGYGQKYGRNRLEYDRELSTLDAIVDQVIESEKVEADQNNEAVADHHYWDTD